MENDLFILGGTNINILDNGHNILDKYKDMSKRNSNFGAIPIKYAQICSTLGLKQIIKHPTRITCYTLTLIDHVIGLFQKKAKQGGGGWGYAISRGIEKIACGISRGN